VHLQNVELQRSTGFPIIKGRLSVGSAADMTALGIPEHDRVLLPLRGFLPNVFVWPVIDVTRNDDGFCDAALGEFGLLLSGIRAEDIGNVSSAGASEAFVRGGTRAGNLIRRNGTTHGLPMWRFHTSIDSFEIRAEHRSDGLHFAISGRFTSASSAPADGPILDGQTFSTNAVIPWETVLLKGLRDAGMHLKFGHWGKSTSKIDSLDQARNPRRLQDLLIDRLFGSCLVKGQILLGPESALPPRRDQYVARFLHVSIDAFDQGSIHFSDASNVELLDNGFASSTISVRSLTIARIGGSALQHWFREKDSLSIELAGDALGHVGYAVDDTERLAPNLVSQMIRTMSVRMMLGKSGLEISAEGELKDFDPAENLRHRTHPNLRLGPVRTYSLSATVPWAFLAARGFGFADRAESF
jgi:hypothetical protein